jgi:hypothetical protein
MTFLRTGADNEPIEMATNEPKRGYGEVEFVTLNLRQKYCCPAHKVAFHTTKKPGALPDLKESSIS